jgi:hypothetical protein
MLAKGGGGGHHGGGHGGGSSIFVGGGWSYPWGSPFGWPYGCDPYFDPLCGSAAVIVPVPVTSLGIGVSAPLGRLGDGDPVVTFVGLALVGFIAYAVLGRK